MKPFSRANELMRKIPISVIERHQSLPGDAPVRLYSYQTNAAYESAQARGYWCGSPEAIKDDDVFEQPYRWMQERMAERIPNFSGDLPMWAWMKRPSGKNKPRKYRGTKENIRLTVVVPRSRILLSDYQAWHCVLNKSLLCSTEQEWDDHYAKYPEGCAAVEEKSWEGCLEFTPSANPDILAWTGVSKYFRVQACVDRFAWDEVKDIRIF